MNKKTLDGPGVYMHIMWRNDNQLQFWLYVGQSVKIRDRLQDHKNITYRKRHPSLHYYVWDSSDDLESEFVILATCQIPGPKEQLILNMQEMWMACIFQTLTAQALEK